MTMHDPREVRKRRAFAPLLMLFGLLFLAAGALGGRQMLSLEHGRASASGTVIKLVSLLPALAFGGMGLLLLALGVSMRMQAVPAGAAAAPVAPTPQAPPREVRHARLWTLALAGVALALIVAPPNHKTGDAALGVLLCVLAALVGAVGVVLNALASVLFAGYGAVVATRSGSARGLDVESPVAAWAAGADNSPRLRSLQLGYAHLRRALWVTTTLLLLLGIVLMGMTALTQARSGH